MKELEKAVVNGHLLPQPLALSRHAVEVLNTPTPKRAVLDRNGPGRKALDVEQAYVISRLNEAFGHVWSFRTQPVEGFEDHSRSRQIVVKGVLKILLPGTPAEHMIKEQYGSKRIEFVTGPNGQPDFDRPLDIGEDLRAAASDALKRCAALLGLACDVYFPSASQRP